MPIYSMDEWREYIKENLVLYEGPLWERDEEMEEILDRAWGRIRALDEDERRQYIKDLIELGLVTAGPDCANERRNEWGKLQ